MHSVCCCSLPVWRRSFLKKGTPSDLFLPALDPPLDGSGRKTTTLVRDLEYFIHTKFHQNPSSGSGEEVENVNSLMERRTTDGQRVITIGHWSLWLLCPNKPLGLSHVWSHFVDSIKWRFFWSKLHDYETNFQKDDRGIFQFPVLPIEQDFSVHTLFS